MSHEFKGIAALAEAGPEGWVWLEDRWPDISSAESIARHYLNTREWEEYLARTSRRRSHWLMGRIAAKDAVRLLYAHGGDLLPANAVGIASDNRGRPVVKTPDYFQEVYVSIAHSGDFVVALSNGETIGIDIELVTQRSIGLEAFALSARERTLLDRAVDDTERNPLDGRPKMFTRFWAAKEAVSKAEGTGLRGNPLAFVVTAIEGTYLHVVCEAGITGTRREYAVQTSTIPGTDSASAEYIVAWTHPHSQPMHSPGVSFDDTV